MRAAVGSDTDPAVRVFARSIEEASESRHYHAVSGSQQSHSGHLYDARVISGSIGASQHRWIGRCANCTRVCTHAESQPRRGQITREQRKHLVGSQTHLGHGSKRLAGRGR